MKPKNPETWNDFDVTTKTTEEYQKATLRLVFEKLLLKPLCLHWCRRLNKVADQGGTIYKQSEDKLRINAHLVITDEIQEKLLFKINK